MSASLPGGRELPESRYDLGTYWGRVQHAAGITDPRTLFTGPSELEKAKQLIIDYKKGHITEMSPRLWDAKKIVDSTLHPDTGQPVLLPFRMSCFVISNLIVTAGMLQPGLQTTGTVAWQVVNQSLNVAINSANANKSSPISTAQTIKSYFAAVTVSCSVAVGLNKLVPTIKRLSPKTRTILTRLVPFAAVASAGALNVFLMRGDEMRTGIDVFPVLSETDKEKLRAEGKAESDVPSLGKSRKAATLAVSETALSRVLNSAPIMTIPPLIMMRLERMEWLQQRPRLDLPIRLGLIGATSLVVLPLALGVFPQRQRLSAGRLEEEFHGKGGEGGMVVFNRGI